MAPAQQPRILIQEHYRPPLDFDAAARGAGVYYYTVSAVGEDESGHSRPIVQSTIGKAWSW
jgi:Tfp pilus assembly protein PilX